MAYVYLNLNPLKRNTGDCVVRALAFATNRSWDDIYWELCEKGFERAEMPSWNSTWWDVLKDLGFTRHIIPDTCPHCRVNFRVNLCVNYTVKPLYLAD